MSNQACPGVTVATVGKVHRSALGFQRLRRSGYVFGRSDWRYSTDDMPKMCLCLVIVFRRRTVFWPPKFTQANEKSVFGEKWPLNGKFSKFRYERIHQHIDSRISARFRGNRLSRSNQTCAWYSSRKKVGILPLSLRLLVWRDLVEILQDHCSPFPLLLHVLSKSVKFSRRYIRKCRPDSLQYRREAYGLLADKNAKTIMLKSPKMFFISQLYTK